MRTIDYISIALKDLRRQRVRSGLTILALVISTVILVTMAAISIGGQQAIVDQLSPDNSLMSVVVTPNQNSGTTSLFGGIQQVNSGANKLDDATVAKLAKLPGAQSAVPRAHIWEFSSFTVADSPKQFVSQAEGVPDATSLPLIAGSGFVADEAQHVAVLGQAYAKELGYNDDPQALVGKTIQITSQKGYRGAGANIPSATVSSRESEDFNKSQTTLQATIVGVTKTGSNQSNVFIPLNWAREIRTTQYSTQTGLKKIDQIANDGYSTILIKATTASDVKTITSSIDQLGYGQISTLAQVERLQQFSTTMWVILGSVAVIAVVAAALGVVNTMLMAVSEQRYAIGVWRAFGATKGFIANQFLIEAGLLGLIGGTIGAGLGVLVSQFVNQYVNTLLKAQGLSLTNIAIIPLWLLAGTILVTTILGILAGLYPAFKAASQDPSKALSSGQ